ncbi:hypothetical protein FA13DRAFT_1729749 [Coprinellus micaceus]|uniref:Uncharacterized protein n=1 Tax=Coprinellus micaceus TaxID=71717 RepID=A0A4Y7TL51_COPMI|nr:hypothetical protein FA13DRAFT_1729749 [Coprinellus micaceus]
MAFVICPVPIHLLCLLPPHSVIFLENTGASLGKVIDRSGNGVATSDFVASIIGLACVALNPCYLTVSGAIYPLPPQCLPVSIVEDRLGRLRRSISLSYSIATNKRLQKLHNVPMRRLPRDHKAR